MSICAKTRNTLKIKRMLLSGVKNTIKVPFLASNYQEVVRLWKIFKRSGSVRDIVGRENDQITIQINQIFSFHSSDPEHIIMYSSPHLSDALLLCKANGKYTNIRLPTPMFSDGFIAVYK